jgi:hypothetical protein
VPIAATFAAIGGPGKRFDGHAGLVDEVIDWYDSTAADIERTVSADGDVSRRPAHPGGGAGRNDGILDDHVARRSERDR